MGIGRVRGNKKRGAAAEKTDPESMTMERKGSVIDRYWGKDPD